MEEKPRSHKHTANHPASLSMSNSCQFTETITGYHQRILLCLNRLKGQGRGVQGGMFGWMMVWGHWNVNDIDAVPLLCLPFGQLSMSHCAYAALTHPPFVPV